MSEIRLDHHATTRYEELQKMRLQMKESDDQWQSDLTKWKNRRKSVNADIVKKKEEREKIESITSGRGIETSTTFTKMQEEREREHKGPLKKGFRRFMSSDEIKPVSRTSLPVFENTEDDVFAQDTPVSHSEPVIEMDSSSTCILESEPATLSSLSSQSSVSLQTRSSTSSEEQDHCHFNSNRPNLEITPIPSKSEGGMEEPRLKNSSEQPSSLSEKASEYPILSYPNMTASSRSLATSSQRSESVRLSSVVTPRPYGTSSNRLTSILRKSTEVKTLDQNSYGIRPGTYVPYLNQPTIQSEEKQQEEMERKKTQEGYNLRVAGNQEKQTKQESLPEQRSMRNSVDLITMSDEDDSTVERKHAEENEKSWLQKEQDEASAYQDGKDVPQLLQPWAKLESMPTWKEDEKPKDMVKSRGMTEWFLGEEMKRRKNPEVRRQQAAAELEAERRNILNAMKYREPERVSVVHSDQHRDSWSRNSTNDLSSGILQDSWMQQQPSSASEKSREWVNSFSEPTSSWKSTITTGSNSFRSHHGYPQYNFSGTSRQSEEQIPGHRSPTQQQHTRSVSGKKICTFCDIPLGKGAAMIIESLGLCYHLTCFKCTNCQSELGGSDAGTEVRIKNGQLYCNSCYMQLKTGHPTII